MIKGIKSRVVIFTGKYGGREYLGGKCLVAVIATKRITRRVIILVGRYGDKENCPHRIIIFSDRYGGKNI